jgi:hypothetical protein
VMAKRGRSIINTHAFDIEHLAKRIELLKDWDVYACLNPARSMAGKPSVCDITTVRRFMVDLDPISSTASTDALLTSVCDWLRSALNIGDHGRTILYTGRGYQVWVPLVPTDETARAAAGIRGIIRTMAGDLGTVLGARVDTTSGEISRVARLPGTVNSKTGRTAAITWTEDYPEISVDDLDIYAEEEYTAGTTLPLANNLESILPAMQPWSREFALFGADARVVSRHSRGYAMVSDLARLGVPQDTARLMLSVACSRCIPPLNDSDWMDRTIHAHY